MFSHENLIGVSEYHISDISKSIIFPIILGPWGMLCRTHSVAFGFRVLLTMTWSFVQLSNGFGLSPPRSSSARSRRSIRPGWFKTRLLNVMQVSTNASVTSTDRTGYESLWLLWVCCCYVVSSLEPQFPDGLMQGGPNHPSYFFIL